MARTAAITVLRSRDEVEQHWNGSAAREGFISDNDAKVTFADAPGDRGTEIHVALPDAAAGKVGEMAEKVTGSEPRAKALDELRRFKQIVETGEVPRSDAQLQGEMAENKPKGRPAQPADDAELQKAGL